MSGVLMAVVMFVLVFGASVAAIDHSRILGGRR